MKMNSFTLLITCLLSYLLISPITTHATSWPSFKAPTLGFLVDNNLIDTASCPAGEGRIVPNLSLNMQRYFCGRFCPGSWEWILHDNQQCHSLTEDFNFQRYEFEYVKNGHDENETLYTTTTAYYGKAGDTKPAFTFTFTSEKDNHWQCTEWSAEYHTVICANDM